MAKNRNYINRNNCVAKCIIYALRCAKSFLKKAPTKNQDGIVYNNNSLNLVVVTKALPQNVEKTLRICLILHNL